MRPQRQRSSLLWAAMAAVLCAGGASTQAQDFEVADVYFELNDTDGDLGIHALIDADAWRMLSLETPRHRHEVGIVLTGSFRRQGLTELFFESAEPNFEDLSPEQFFNRFPEGDYVVHAKSIENQSFEMADTVNHLMPAPAQGLEVNGVELPENCDEELPSLSPPFTIAWESVEMSHPTIGRTNESIEVAKYQLVLEREDEALIFTIDLPPEITEVEIPAGFAESGEEFKVEVIAKEASGGNQTAVETCFLVE
jgi:hypothetical protein